MICVMHKYNVTNVDISQTATCSLNLGVFVLRIGMIIIPLFLRYFFALASLHSSLLLYVYLHIIAMYIMLTYLDSQKVSGTSQHRDTNQTRFIYK
jgi:hypothetical protein